MATPVRTSDDRRERVAGRLGRGFADGSLSTETFELRAGLAYAARDEHELSALVSDLPRRGAAWREALDRLRSRLARPASAAAEVVVPEPPHDAARTGLVIGRNPDCNFVLEHPSVSRHHCELRREAGRWIVADLGSSNGTRVNGWRVERATVGSGDELMLGDQRVVFGRPRAAVTWWQAPERP
jgi:hypothetical protein